MERERYEIRSMTPQEATLAVAWAEAEGWNPGRFDLACFLAADPDGFLTGLLDGQPIAVISAVKYAASFGFLGFYVVAPEYRGQGYGLRLWNAALERLAGRTIGLDGVVAQQENYRKSGFEFSFRTLRMQGTCGGPAPVDPEIVPLREIAFDTLREYDRTCFPAERTAFLERWIRQPESTPLGILHGGQLAGYGMIRTCGTGRKIGPLFADSPELAERLHAALIAAPPPGTPYWWDVVETNAAAVEMAGRLGLNRVFECARMYAGKAPELPLQRIFGTTSLELG